LYWVAIDFAGGERGQHDAVALDISHLQIEPMFGEQAVIVAHPQRCKAAADRRIADIDRRELFVLCLGRGRSSQRDYQS
jgi:hypothetical protein